MKQCPALIVATVFLTFTASFAGAEVVTIDVTVKAIDAKERSITVTKTSKTKSKDIELEVGKKAKILLDGKEATLDAVKAGQKASVSYETELEVVTKIEVTGEGDPAGEPLSDEPTPEILNIEEINSEVGDTSPWLSDDGLTIWWDAKDVSGNSKEDWIWTAQRKDPESLFEGKKKVFRGRFPVVTSDGLEIIFGSTDFDGFSVATRKAIGDSFGRPQRITELKVEKLYARPRSLSSDGLSLYFDATKLGNKSDETWVSTRGKQTEKWQSPIPVKIAIPGVSMDAHFTQVFLTRDGLHLFCTAAVPKGNDQDDVHPAVLSRETPDGTFTKYQRLTFGANTSKASDWRVIRYIESTNEMVVIYGGRSADLWLVKNFTPPYTKK